MTGTNQQNFSIQSLELTDFMKFRHRVFNFGEDLSIVVGPNGTGKSAILEALALSFQVKDRGSSVASYIRHGKDAATVKLNCTWLSKPLTIETTFSKAGRRIHRVVVYDESTYEDTQANNYLLEFFDNKSLIVAFALQGNEKFLTTSKATNLKNLISLLQLDFSKETVYSKTKLQSFEKEKTDLVNDLNKQQGVKETFESSLKQTKQQLDFLQAQLTEAQSKPSIDTTALDKQLFELQNNLQQLLQTKKDADLNLANLTTARRNLENSEKELSGIEAQLQDLAAKETEEQSKEAVQEQLSQLENSLQELQNSLKAFTADSSNISSNIAALRTSQSFELNRKQQLASGVCPTCSQKIPQALSLDLDSKIQTIENDLKELENKLEESNQKKQKAEKDIQDKTVEQKNVNAALNEIDRRNAEIKHNQVLKEQLEKSKKLLQENIETAKLSVQQLETKYNESATDKSQDIANLTIQISSFEDQKKAEKDRLDNIKILESRLADCKQSIASFEASVNSCDSLISSKEQQIDSVQHGVDDWSRAQEVFNLLPKLHLKSFIDDIESVCSSIAIEFGYKGIKIDSDEKGISFALQDWPLDDVDEADTPYEMCSAFEKNLVNLALVYALSRMFRVPFVCIDELDASADTENTAKLGELVKLILKYTPVVTVSHDGSLVSNLLQSNYKVSILKTVEEEK